jgi:hypothetical protein
VGRCGLVSVRFLVIERPLSPFFAVKKIHGGT